jgi:hypothetical protein
VTCALVGLANFLFNQLLGPTNVLRFADNNDVPRTRLSVLFHIDAAPSNLLNLLNIVAA